MAKVWMCPHCGGAYVGENCTNKRCPGYLPDGAYNHAPQSSVEPESNAVSKAVDNFNPASKPTTSFPSTPTEKGT